MKIIFVLLFAFTTTFCFSQNPFNVYAKSTCGNTAFYKDYYSNGNLRLKFTIINGNLEGEYLDYYRNGKIMDSTFFEHGHYHGTNKTFNEKGQLILIEKYKHDTLLFNKDIFYYKNGNVKTEVYLYFDTDSLKMNPFVKTTIHSSGQNPDMNYNNDLSISKMKSHGKDLEYYKNGKIKEEKLTVNNLYNGVYKWFNKDGTLAGEGNIINDKSDGNFIYYSRTGKVTKIESWKEGKLIKTVKKNGCDLM